MRPIVPRHVGEASQPEISLVDERGGLQRMARPLRAEMPGRDRAKLRVDEGEEPLECTVVPLLPGPEIVRDLGARCGLRVSLVVDEVMIAPQRLHEDVPPSILSPVHHDASPHDSVGPMPSHTAREIRSPLGKCARKSARICGAYSAT